MTLVNNGLPYNRKGQPLKKIRKYHNVRNTKPLAKTETEREYDFLKYIRVVFRWATEHTGLSRPEIEVILYLYSKGVFTKAEFADYYKTIGLTTKARWQKYMDDGWIREWRTSKRNMKGLFDLTSKAKIVCSKMHQMCVGDMDIPTSRRSNPMNRNKDIKINAHYTKLFKQMNAERNKTKEEDE
jgi:hypothetical protein